jgi:hypothetical protein
MAAEQVGAVLVFGESYTKAQVKHILLCLQQELLNDPNNRTGETLESINVQTFDPRYSSPVFYCP